MIFTGVHFPPLQSLSDTLHAATPRRKFIRAFKTIVSPGLERGRATVIEPSPLIFVCMNKFSG